MFKAWASFDITFLKPLLGFSFSLGFGSIGIKPSSLGPLNDPDQDSEGGVIFEQARELTYWLGV